ncbi:hypothetical protein OF83DRAFT_1152786 [Amylostereum chailletii]|nr:hypothetical protein OF83DRAFT_1152786 [Amylostereum chailletii]
MGKWTSEHYDDVLSSKIKSLVSGAVKRSRLEKAEHTISYEAFVEELDSGDSFTTSLIELLVKELAERRQRQATTDKHLISDSTCKGLRMLAAPQRTYRRGLVSRRTINLTDYLAVPPPDEMEVDDEDEDDGSTENLLDPTGALEGARMTTALWDAYSRGQPEAHTSTSTGTGTSSTSASTARARARLTTRPSMYREEIQAIRRSSARSPSSTDPLGTLFNATSNQPTLPSSLSRRPPARSRPRVTDFDEFTSRRRSVTRESSTSGARTPAADDARRNSNGNNAWPGHRFFLNHRRTEPWSDSEAGSGTPPPVPPPVRSTTLRDPSAFLTWLTGAGAEESLPPLPPPRSLTLRAASASFGADEDGDEEAEASQPPSQPPSQGPRSLRRGGVPRPEDLMPWHVSIATEEGAEVEAATAAPVSDVRHQSPEREVDA